MTEGMVTVEELFKVQQLMNGEIHVFVAATGLEMVTLLL